VRTQSTGTAVVVAADSVGALGAIRSLGRLGVRVFVVDPSTAALGLRSRFATPWRCPDPRDDEDGFIASLSALADELGEPVPIFPSSDVYLDSIARNYRNLEGRFLFPFTSGDHVLRMRNKHVQTEAAAAEGVPVPRTAERPSDDLRFPIVVKASNTARFVTTFGVKGIRCDSPVELEEVFERAQGLDPLLQEWIPGGDDRVYVATACLSHGGENLGVATHRKLLQTPPGLGTIRSAVAFPIPELAALGVRFLKATAIYGPSMVEFKLDPRDGVYKFIEANLRINLAHALSAAVGVDVVQLAYKDLMGLHPSPARQRRRAKRWSITFLTGSGLDRPGHSGSGPAIPRLPYRDAVFDATDPWPAVVQAKRVLSGLLHRLRA
jgi:D-aspartate ligase